MKSKGEGQGAATAVRGRGRPRNPENDAAILKAAREILATSGFDALTFEAVAQMTGISRVTIYRRWPSKAHLVNEIANGGDDRFPDVIEGEGLMAEIRALLGMIHDRYSRKDVAAAAIGMIVSWQKNPGLLVELDAWRELEARDALKTTIEKGKRLGLVREDVDSDAVFDIAVGSIMYGTLFSSRADRRPAIDRIAELIVQGAAPKA